MALRPRRAQIWSAPPTCVDLVRLCAAILRNSPTRRLRQHLAQAPSTNPSAPSSRAGGHRVEDWLTWRCCATSSCINYLRLCAADALGWLCASRSRSPPSDVQSPFNLFAFNLLAHSAAESNFDILSAKLVDLDSYDIGHALGLGLGLPHHALNSSPPANAKLVVHSRGRCTWIAVTWGMHRTSLTTVLDCLFPVNANSTRGVASGLEWARRRAHIGPPPLRPQQVASGKREIRCRSSRRSRCTWIAVTWGTHRPSDVLDVALWLCAADSLLALRW
ncbi:hypothetical protein C8F04DRAFT_1265219 [Mycena alexandri]|uniref:Uncharacterized protein n=1 Tax=Mycena alexandri TaxID=1745969 RepID=A0AAD6SKV4_9AGAR|nr:hypothetical protein C8F04DRAFT_1265219 [Mycena alexandri]